MACRDSAAPSATRVRDRLRVRRSRRRISATRAQTSRGEGVAGTPNLYLPECLTEDATLVTGGAAWKAGSAAPELQNILGHLPESTPRLKFQLLPKSQLARTWKPHLHQGRNNRLSSKWIRPSKRLSSKSVCHSQKHANGFKPVGVSTKRIFWNDFLSMPTNSRIVAVWTWPMKSARSPR